MMRLSSRGGVLLLAVLALVALALPAQGRAGAGATTSSLENLRRKVLNPPPPSSTYCNGMPCAVLAKRMKSSVGKAANTEAGSDEGLHGDMAVDDLLKKSQPDDPRGPIGRLKKTEGDEHDEVARTSGPLGRNEPGMDAVEFKGDTPVGRMANEDVDPDVEVVRSGSASERAKAEALAKQQACDASRQNCTAMAAAAANATASEEAYHIANGPIGRGNMARVAELAEKSLAQREMEAEDEADRLAEEAARKTPNDTCARRCEAYAAEQQARLAAADRAHVLKLDKKGQEEGASSEDQIENEFEARQAAEEARKAGSGDMVACHHHACLFATCYANCRKVQPGANPTDLDPTSPTRWVKLAVLESLAKTNEDPSRRSQDATKDNGFYHANDRDFVNMQLSNVTKVLPLYNDGPDFSLNNALNHPERLLSALHHENEDNLPDHKPELAAPDSSERRVREIPPGTKSFTPQIGELPGASGLASTITGGGELGVETGLVDWERHLPVRAKMVETEFAGGKTVPVPAGGEPLDASPAVKHNMPPDPPSLTEPLAAAAEAANRGRSLGQQQEEAVRQMKEVAAKQRELEEAVAATRSSLADVLDRSRHAATASEAREAEAHAAFEKDLGVSLSNMKDMSAEGLARQLEQVEARRKALEERVEKTRGEITKLPRKQLEAHIGGRGMDGVSAYDDEFYSPRDAQRQAVALALETAGELDPAQKRRLREVHDRGEKLAASLAKRIEQLARQAEAAQGRVEATRAQVQTHDDETVGRVEKLRKRLEEEVRRKKLQLERA